MGSNDNSLGYAGDLGALEAWALLEAQPDAQLVDVRSSAEWAFVGGPDLSALGRRAHCVEWQMFPTMAVNPAFVADTSAAIGGEKDKAVLMLCRSGGRSQSAARAMTEAGYTHVYNVAGGFEGDLNEMRHRGARNGWKACGLPWKQS